MLTAHLTDAYGSRYIVTELVSGGSLEQVLHDPGRNLPWVARVKIGLQVSLGMDHLHNRQMLHRDLKSANVLLDENLNAKVCDFGLSRVVKPARAHVVFSPFTGTVRLLPCAGDVAINNGQSPLSMTHVGVSIVDASGTMTMMAGTMRWMAPEVFRGDQNYTKAVDLYSFGIVLWELATRETPWSELANGHREVSLFANLNRALKLGQRPTIPMSVLDHRGAFVAVMKRCWAGDPADRPSFSETSRDLAAILSTW